MMTYELLFDATNRGPICNDVTILTDDIYEFEESLTYNLTSDDRAVILDPSGGVMVIQDDDGETLSNCLYMLTLNFLFVYCRDNHRMGSGAV